MKNIIKRYSDYGWAVETNDDGGFAEMVFGYLTSWLGPVLEINDLTDDKTALSPILNSITHIQNIICKREESDFLKRLGKCYITMQMGKKHCGRVKWKIARKLLEYMI